MNKTTVKNDNGSDIKFTGEEVASAASSADTAHPDYSGMTGRSTTLRLYRTKAAKYVGERVEHTQWQGEHDTHEACVCESEAEVIEFFGHDRLAKELYNDADIEDVTDID